MSDWQPIETAPKDRAILVYISEAEIFAVVRWHPDGSDQWPWLVLGGGDRWNRSLVKKWKPLPPPPTQAESQ